MRETKYKAWILPTKRMANVTGLCWQSKGLAVEVLLLGETDVDSKAAQEFWWNGKEAVLREFTGLKDKNGMEIYEGDILDCGSGLYPVTWSDEWGWGLDISGQEWYSVSDYVRFGCVIRGNVHENPELLK